MIGEVLEQTWTVIAAERDGEPLVDEIGRRMVTRRASFAFRDEAEAWLAEQAAEGWAVDGEPCPLATRYFGETDSPSNCWSASVEREALDAVGS